MPGLLPDIAAAAIRSRWPDIGARWCDAVETELAELLKRYETRSTTIMRARYSLVVAIEAGDGRHLVLRGSPDPAARDQYAVAAALARLGVGPAIHEYAETDTGTWTVAERIRPGTPIGDLQWSEVDPAAIGAALRAVAHQPAPAPGLPCVYAWLRERLLAGDALTDLAPSATHPAPASERQRAIAVLDDLEARRDNELCHGDASPWNLLTGATGRIFLIDPRGMSGEVEYDVAVVALKATPFVPAAETVPYLSDVVGVDPARVDAWLAVASAARV